MDRANARRASVRNQRCYSSIFTRVQRRYSSPHPIDAPISRSARKNLGDSGCHSASPRKAYRIVPGNHADHRRPEVIVKLDRRRARQQVERVVGNHRDHPQIKNYLESVLRDSLQHRVEPLADDALDERLAREICPPQTPPSRRCRRLSANTPSPMRCRTPARPRSSSPRRAPGTTAPPRTSACT